MRGQVPLTQEHFLDSLRIWGGTALPSPLNAPSQCYSFLGRHWAHLCHQNFTSKSKMVLKDETAHAVFVVISKLVEMLEE